MEMIEDKCYWANISKSTSPEGLAFQAMFDIDYQRCRDSCPKVVGEECELFLSIAETRKGVDQSEYYKKLPRKKDL
jgi:hypothetical protein